jgi:hypothetical protein
MLTENGGSVCVCVFIGEEEKCFFFRARINIINIWPTHWLQKRNPAPRSPMPILLVKIINIDGGGLSPASPARVPPPPPSHLRKAAQ